MNAAETQIQNQTALASTFYQYLPDDSSFLDNTCINNLLNGSLNVLFEPPNLAGLLQGLINQGCNILETMKAQAEEPLDNLANTVNGQEAQALDFGEVAPGLNLGGMNNIIDVQPNGSSGGSLVQSNLTSMFTSSYQSPYLTSMYQNGLLGNANQ